MTLAPGALTDVGGLSVGHAAAAGRATGCTVVLCPQGAVCGVAQRGASPGSRETDLLRPENSVQQVHALLLTGGSAFGLDAAGGVMRWLEERGHGYPVGPSVRVPIVPAAVLFDLWLGDAHIRPDAGTGHAACLAASTAAPAQGNAGAGLGATVGKLFGITRAMKGGLGTASLRLGRCTVAALVAVNALGDVIDGDGRVIAGARAHGGEGDDGGSTSSLLAGGSTAALLAGAGPAAMMAGMATTLGVVATDAQLTKAQATALAGLAHHGLSRSISPLTVNDGDTLFALATGGAGVAGDLNLLGALAAEAVALAIRNAVRAAQSLPALAGSPAVPAACDLHGGA